ncbi:MAG TPA: RNA polymerase sigma factor [Conexibacter sp.]|nr:RNA polymerase sigma factor [Conexibacter sp.]
MPAPATATGRRIVAGPLLRLRSDEQLVRLFRAGSEEAFRVIHDRYRTRLFAYARQMLGGSRADAEDALQDVFVRAYGALRASDRAVSLRAWLYRIAHNRCIDELRRAGGAGALNAPAEVLELVQAPASDPMDAVERRESLRRLVEDVQRLPEQQRSALLMREISGMAYQDLAAALDVTVPAVKSLLVRARIGLAQAAEARDTACAAIRADLAAAHERGVRASGLVKRHLHDCKGCSAYKRELRAIDARLAALVPALGPVALFAKLLGIGGGSAGVAGGGAAAAGGGAAAAGAGAAGVSLSHVAAAVAVAVVSAGGAVEVQHQLVPHQREHAAIHRSAPAPAAAAVGVAATTPALDAARRQEAAERLWLRVIPSVTGEELVVEPSAPTLDPAAAGNGGATAPTEPPADTLDPVTPLAGDVIVDDADAGATSGSTTTAPPATGSSTAAPEPPPPSEPAPAPPATSAEPTSSSAPTAPPTSATVGGATYRPR